ncbi:hypothetical protein [Burkholderia cenocepacia]|uniref:hypothetical protein n=1 Tax=Burkholderia cenocepacia TaxID=95486 RepID=UPI002AB0F11D|nr:hypothetical protein [Burkholderia cenocepacia]
MEKTKTTTTGKAMSSEKKESKAKVMSRSRNQLATSYAPESFFTFEGGLGACISRSSAGEHIELSDTTISLIYERMNELGRAWFETAMSARANDVTQPEVLPSQCVESALLDDDRTNFLLPGVDRFYLCKPSHMEYSPAPLAFVCRTCGLFRDYEDLNALDKDLPYLTPEHCQDPKKARKCDWEQLDVIFVHWSGNWEQPFPGQWQWSDKEAKAVKRRDTCICGSQKFRINRRSAAIGDWFFTCAVCEKPLSQKWLQNDKDTLWMLRNLNSPQRLTEVRMQAAPYRASSAYYVKSDLFIDFKDGNQQLLTKLRPGREDELKDFIASTYGFAVERITEEDVIKACEGKPECKKDLANYLSAVATIAQANEQLEKGLVPEGMKPMVQSFMDTAIIAREGVIKDLRDREILLPKVELPFSVSSLVKERRNRFASKYDPVRLAVEHAALKNTRLDVETRVNGKKPYVSFTRLDEDLSSDDHDKTEATQIETRGLLDQLGFVDMGLIREFDLCRFSFGYSRMDSTPVLRDKRGMNMPVRLRLFPPVRNNDSSKFPVYVVQQGNEALYVRLKEEVVLQWLQSLGCADMFALKEGERLGAGILGVTHPMGPFLDGLPETDTPPVYLYLYTLLHSYAHLLMKHVSEYSGLDLGSVGEYIFPADLAFVVYRNGTTMDLGNLSALWRNSGNAMLSALLGSKATLCGTGSLCTHRGGACPDCIMAPETSCVAGNKLLSRSVLRSVGGRPRFDTRKGSICGYLDFVAK